MMRALDLFSGIGGFSLGLERAGMQTVAFCEIDPFCRRVQRKHWPEVPCHDDITTREFHENEADVICGGFPCQDISLAGYGAGLAGERSGLFRVLVRAIRLVRPAWALLENVAALLGRGMGEVLGDLAEIGYDAEWHCIPASAVGAPHKRDRVWIIANPGSEQHESGCAPISGQIAEKLAQAALANAHRGGIAQQAGSERQIGLGIVVGGEALADTDRQRCEIRSNDGSGSRKARGTYARREAFERDWWLTEPDVGRVAHGVPARVDRLRGLGNAVVPQIPELIGRAILEAAA